ncbi:hypothetical protein SLEP1_g43222 [Rubroshorea leprosula]|uniref:Uncharacterized protein n=1 Tax=Rubroshorea leprosula TaxID=152421 RepID=A0AAV5LD93_9ROSI|nr:hypothetical protein SLEP1_g43222 [Rubroshorea leprosula]
MQINPSTLDSDLDAHDSFLLQEHGEDEEDEEFSGFILTRDCCSLSTNLHELKVEKERHELDSAVRKTVSMRADKQNSRLENAVKRAFSMRASPSVMEKYQRIDNEYDLVGNGEDDLLMMPPTESTKKGNKILEACRRFFRFQSVTSLGFAKKKC